MDLISTVSEQDTLKKEEERERQTGARTGGKAKREKNWRDGGR